MIKLGSKVKDLFTGFTGIAVARTEWLYGCARIVIEPDKLDDKGALIKMESFDEQRIIVLEAKGPDVSPDSSAKSGGPYPDADRGR